jgi:flagellar basal-body rod modification protein FlgD
MDLSSISGLVSQSTLESAAASSSSNDELGKDTFLKLLTTQLQYQDPLNPMSNEEFVAQLAQFSSLEQLQTMSAGMESLYLVNMSMNNAALTGLIGKDVVATGSELHYSGEGSVTLNYDASAATTSSTITITNTDGQVVYSGDMGALAEGDGSWTWDGKDMDGQTVPDGDYSFAIEGTDADGNSIAVDGRILGTVEGMDLSTGTPLLTVNGVTIDLSAILSVSQTEEGT